MRSSSTRGVWRAPALMVMCLVGLFVVSGASQARFVQTATTTPRAAKEDVRSTLLTLVPSSDRKTARQIGEALKHLDLSLTSAWWSSDATLDPTRGGKVFTEEHKAAQQLAAVKHPVQGVTDAIGALVEADRQLAQTAIDAAAGGDPKWLARARDEMGKAGGEIAKGHPNVAIGHYGKAWAHALGAAAHPAGSQTFTLRTCTVPELIAAINAANATTAADTITLTAGCVYTLAESIPTDPWEGGLPVVVNPLTIHGNGATIERDPSAPLFSLLGVRGSTAGGTFAVDHVTFRGGASSMGGAIAVRWQGGPSGPVAPPPSVVVTDSTFVGNSTVSVPYFDPGGAGGAIAVEGVNFGGVSSAGSTVTLERDTFTGNSTHDQSENVLNSSDTRSGGAVYIGGVGETRITGCTFTGNRTGAGADETADAQAQPGGRGGAVGVASYGDSPVTVTDSIFVENSTGPGGDGTTGATGGIGASGGRGGAIAVDRSGPGAGASLTLAGDTFTRNSTGEGGQGLTANGSAGNGGAVSFFGSALSVGAGTTTAKTTFTDNLAGDGTNGMTGFSVDGSAGAGGGAIFAETLSGSPGSVIADSTFSGNTSGGGGASSPANGNGGNGGSGGAVAFDMHGPTLTLARDTFAGNSAGAGGQGVDQDGYGGSGGAVSVNGQGVLAVTGCTFDSNATTTNGGAMVVFGPVLTVSGSTFSTNSGQQGSAISVPSTNGTDTISDTLFDGNSTSGLPGQGGAVQIFGSSTNVALVHDVFTQNTSGGMGGAVRTGAGADLSVTDSTFDGNSGSWASAIAVDSNLTITRSTFTANGTGSEGTAVYWGSQGGGRALTVIDSTFAGNSGGISGSMCGNGPSPPCTDALTVTGSTFTGNEMVGIMANLFGPGTPASHEQGTLSITNSTFSGNGAVSLAGGRNSFGAIIFGRGTASIMSTTVSGNTGQPGVAGGITLETGAIGTIVNTIVVGSNPGLPSHGLDCSATDSTMIDGGGNLTTVDSTGCPGTFLIGNPGLQPPALNAPGLTATMALVPGSDAIDNAQANDAACPSTDQRGISRPQGTHCDIGAYEYKAGP